MRLRARAFIMAKAAKEQLDTKDEMTVKEAIDSVQQVERLGLLRRQSSGKEEANTATVSADPEKTVCFVSADVGMGSDLLTMKVVKRLEHLLPREKGSGKPLCRLENLSIRYAKSISASLSSDVSYIFVLTKTIQSGTHTHSAPGGFLQYTLYQINTLGYSEETMNIYVEGIAQSILR